MLKRSLTALALLAVALVGCGKATTTDNAPPPKPEMVPVHRSGTVSQVCYLNRMNIQVSGYGLVVGLGNKGSREVDPRIEKYMVEYLLKNGLGSYRLGTEKLTPERVLRDRDTAVVLVSASLPPLAPPGTRFDVYVQSLPQTQTVSIEGGHLMPTDLFRVINGIAMPMGGSPMVARSIGSVFQDPNLDPNNARDLLRFREGRILNGGVLAWQVPIQLVLMEADYSLCVAIAQRINERFKGDDRAVANPTNNQVIELTIPRAYKHDYQHFLELVMHLPVVAGPGIWEAKAAEVAAAMETPEANHHELALVWEAMGRSILPIIGPLYSSKNPVTAFFAARAGLRLGDSVAMDVVARTARGTSHDFLRVLAVQEIGRVDKPLLGLDVLREMVDDRSEPVRLAAYEALLKRGDNERIESINVEGLFTLDLVKTADSPYMVYATQTGRPRIAVFGAGLNLQREVFFAARDGLVTINSSRKAPGVQLYRKIERTGKLSATFTIDHGVKSLVLTLGQPPRFDKKGKIMGLGLSYGQVVCVLKKMCQSGDIRAKFVLQPMADAKTIYESTRTSRPEMPE